jgi:hypothetical protein
MGYQTQKKNGREKRDFTGGPEQKVWNGRKCRRSKVYLSLRLVKAVYGGVWRMSGGAGG